ncbi:hypothetical protein [Neptuniibacter sp. QD37_11]|uniref:hypothetical protein n=1 Tax=Neptuniibacter sp. QD37_11 TaxID=3398209 RepID=UPI0039F51DD2
MTNTSAQTPSEMAVNYVIVMLDNGYITINDVVISEEVFQTEMVPYRWTNREGLIKNIHLMMSDAIRSGRNSDYALMDSDVDYLKTLNSDYVFVHNSDNEYVSYSDDKDTYREICQSILDANAQLADVDRLSEIIIGTEVEVDGETYSVSLNWECNYMGVNLAEYRAHLEHEGQQQAVKGIAQGLLNGELKSYSIEHDNGETNYDFAGRWASAQIV